MIAYGKTKALLMQLSDVAIGQENMDKQATDFEHHN
jgi:hypothetical protein